MKRADKNNSNLLESGDGRRLYTLLVFSVLLIAVALSIFLIPTLLISKNELKEKEISEELAGVTGEAEDGGGVISREAIEQTYGSLPEDLRGVSSGPGVSDSIVNQNLLSREADREDIVVTDEEVDDFIELGLARYSIDEREYRKRLDEYNVTEDEYREEIRQQIKIAKLINQSIKPEEYAVSDEEVDAFLDENKEDFEDFFMEGNEQQLSLLRERIRVRLKFEKQNMLLEEFLMELQGE